MRIWTVGAKVSNVEAELAFVEAIGGSVILRDDRVEVAGRTYRIPLVRWGDTRVHLAQEMVYESELEMPLPFGLAHIVFAVDDLPSARERALAAGAREINPVTRVEAGFGVRDVAFLRSPGGTLFEYIQIIRDGLGE